MDTLIGPILNSFVTLFIILDPFLGLAVFTSLTAGMKEKEKAQQAFIAVAVAFVLLIVFMFVGLTVLDLLKIDFSSFKIAGGIILFGLGVQSIRGTEFSRKQHDTKVAAVIIGTPLLCGPGAMTAVTILSENYGYLAPFIGAVLSLYFIWVILLYSGKIERFVSARFVQIMSRIMGLVLAALAVEFVKEGIIEAFFL